MLDKRQIIDLCLLYNEAVFVHQDYRVIDMWVVEGCDIEKDILPAMREAMGKWKDITKITWFRKGAYRKRDERRERELVQERLAVKNAPPDADSELRKAKMLAKTIRVLNVRRADQVRWLADYEAKHGRVEA